MPLAEKLFWVRGEDGQAYGPAELDELREWVQENRAGIGTDVRLDEADAPWLPWQNFPELVALLAEVRVTAPALTGLVLAQIWKRIMAGTLDLILVSFLMAILTNLYWPDFSERLVQAWSEAPHWFATPQLSEEDRFAGSLILHALLTLYLGVFICLRGRTPAMSFLKLKVVNGMGQKPDIVQSLLRGLMFALSVSLGFIPMLYIFFNPERRTFHDVVAGTFVVEA